jgi:hypothetical protein
MRILAASLVPCGPLPSRLLPTGVVVASTIYPKPNFRGLCISCLAGQHLRRFVPTRVAPLPILSLRKSPNAIVLRRVPKSSKESGNADGGPSTGPNGGVLGSDQGGRGQLGRAYPSYGKSDPKFMLRRKKIRYLYYY